MQHPVKTKRRHLRSGKPSAPRLVPETMDDLYARPGFLLRRGHQIAVGIFVQECEAIGLTSAQHGVLVVVGNMPGLDQAGLARALGFDRATVGDLVQALERRGMLRREGSPEDLRRKLLVLTAAGSAMLICAQEAVRRTSERILSPLKPAERELFVGLLARLTDTLNAASRTPVQAPEGQDEQRHDLGR
jgi:DNA-binding MarR family transcriptional regulator